jgi:hypothetical protein
LWYALKYTLGVRVSAVEETEGLDLHEIGVLAYNGDALAPNPEATPEATANALSAAAQPAMAK